MSSKFILYEQKLFMAIIIVLMDRGMPHNLYKSMQDHWDLGVLCRIKCTTVKVLDFNSPPLAGPETKLPYFGSHRPSCYCR